MNSWYAIIFALLSLVLVGCSPGGGSGDATAPTSGNQGHSNDFAQSGLLAASIMTARPVAVIDGTYNTDLVEKGFTVELDGSKSHDPDGIEVTFEWTILSSPLGSTSYLSDNTAESPSFVADEVGDYEIQLIVSDGTDYSEPQTVLVTAVERNPPGLNWGFAHELNTGEDPGVAINNQGVVVEVDESPNAYDLWYRVGIIRGGLIEWGSSHKFFDSDALEGRVKPSVAISDNSVAVVTYSNAAGVKVYYKVGVIDKDNRTISFGSERDVETGKRPTIAVNNHNKAMVVYSDYTASSSGICEISEDLCQIWGRVGDIDVANKKINWGSEIHRGHGLEPAVDINDAGKLVIVYEGYTTDTLYYRSGQIEGRSWTQLTSGSYGQGEAPDIALNNDGRVVVVHEHATDISLYSAIGRLRNGTLDLRPALAYDNRGQVPTVGLNDNNQFVAMHDYGDGVPLISTSHVVSHFTTDFIGGKNYATWMGDTRAVGFKTLRNLMLPGTHDSAAYDLNIGNSFDNSAAWAHGPDWKGFEKACEEIEEGWLGDWLRDKCTSVLKDAVPYTQNQVARNITTAQSLEVWEQLEQGIRYFDLRVTYRDPVEYPYWPGFRVFHGLIGGELDPILLDIRAYLESVDSELLILNFSHLNVGTHADLDWRRFTSEEHDVLMAKIIDALGEFAIAKDTTTPEALLSTRMQELTKEGPAVILIYEWHTVDCSAPGDSLCGYFWRGGDLIDSISGYTNTADLRFQETGTSTDDDGNITRKGQRLHFEDYVASESTELFALYQTLTANADIATENALSLARPFKPTLRVLSQDANQHLATFIEESKPRFPQIVIVDFPEESDVVEQAIRIGSLCNPGPISGQVTPNTPRVWPPNHEMIPVDIDVSELALPNPEHTIFEIDDTWIEEPNRKTGENMYTPGSHEPDLVITDNLALQIRRERSGQAEERIYGIGIKASDCSGDYHFITEVRISHDSGSN
jgi:hypothetical protein